MTDDDGVPCDALHVREWDDLCEECGHLKGRRREAFVEWVLTERDAQMEEFMARDREVMARMVRAAERRMATVLGLRDFSQEQPNDAG